MTKKNKKKTIKKEGVNPPSTAVTYNGPTRVPGASEQRDMVTVPLIYTVELASTVIGEVLNVFGSSPSSCTDWGSLAAMYDEYRTLSIEVHYTPYDRYNRGTAVYTTSMVVCTDQDDIVPLTSYVAGLTYASSKLMSFDQPWKRVVKMSGIENAVWTTTAAPLNLYCVKTYGNGLTNSTTYGRIVIYYLVQVRGRN